MRGLILKVAGIACVVLGALILSGRITNPTAQQTIDLGVIRATTETRERFPDWAGFVALGAGVVLLLGGGRARD